MEGVTPHYEYNYGSNMSLMALTISKANAKVSKSLATAAHSKESSNLTLSCRYPSIRMGYIIPSSVNIICLRTSLAPSHPLVPFGYIFTKWDS